MDVELRHLRAFVTVAQLSSFTKAAQQLLITQPALSRTIQQLENAVQVTLFDRNSRNVQLTPAGHQFLAPAERVLASLDTALAAVRPHVILRLGFSWLLPDPWAQHTIAQFEQATGGRVELVRTDDPLAGIQDASVDVAVVRGARPGVPRVRTVHLFDETRVAVCSEHSRLAGRESVDWHEVPAWPLVVNTVSGTTGPWSWPPDQRPGHIIETRNYDEWLESIAADRGIGVAPDVALRRSIHPAVRFIPLTSAPPCPVLLAYLPHVREPLMRHFIDAAVTAADHHESA